MPEPTAPEINNNKPSLGEEKREKHRRLRTWTESKFPEAERILKKAGKKPEDTTREKISIAAHLLRKELEGETDKLTGIGNRDRLIREGKEALERAKRMGKKVAIVMLDVNFLKQTNDTKGHEAGDQLLKDVAECLRLSTRETDTIARWGGDEYGTVLENTDYEGAQKWWERASEFFSSKNVSIGAGVIVADPEEINIHEDWETQFIKYEDMADKPLYKAKELTKSSGKNTLVSYPAWVKEKTEELAA